MRERDAARTGSAVSVRQRDGHEGVGGFRVVLSLSLHRAKGVRKGTGALFSRNPFRIGSWSLPRRNGLPPIRETCGIAARRSRKKPLALCMPGMIDRYGFDRMVRERNRTPHPRGAVGDSSEKG